MEKFKNNINVIIKISLLLSAWIFAQVQPLAEAGIQEAFDYAFSIGMMALFVLYMIYENRKKDTNLVSNQKVYIDLITENTRAIGKFSEALVLINKNIESGARERQDLFKEISENLRQLNNNLMQRNQ